MHLQQTSEVGRAVQFVKIWWIWKLGVRIPGLDGNRQSWRRSVARIECEFLYFLKNAALHAFNLASFQSYDVYVIVISITQVAKTIHVHAYLLICSLDTPTGQSVLPADGFGRVAVTSRQDRQSIPAMRDTHRRRRSGKDRQRRNVRLRADCASSTWKFYLATYPKTFASAAAHLDDGH